MNKYKVEIEIVEKFIVDVLAKDEQEAGDKAIAKFAEIRAQNIEHYYQDGDTEEQIGTIYNVTDTDDPFNP